MSISPYIRAVTLAAISCASFVADAGDLTTARPAAVPEPTVWSSLQPYADFRLRYESDWDSTDTSGEPRDDRQRLRVRGRVGLKIQPSDFLLIDVRGRTGNPDSQQSPHLTFYDFDGGDNDEFDGIFDKYYVRYQDDGLAFWAGRNGFPFWKQNELFWDDDVTITGAALTLTPEDLDGVLTTTVGAFYLPDGGWGLNGQLYAGQITYSRSVGGFDLTAADGIYYLNGNEGAEHLRNGNGARDYAIVGSQWQAGREVFSLPMAFGVDFYYNLKNYPEKSGDAFTAAHSDDTFGSVLSLNIGELKRPGDLQFGYYYAWLETLAVNGSYAEDDWERWGSATQTDSSDLRGHEFRLAYRLMKNLDLMARLYAVDAITSPQDGMRFRLDFNYKF